MLSPPEDTRSLWHIAQVLPSTGCTAASNADAGASAAYTEVAREKAIATFRVMFRRFKCTAFSSGGYVL
jgi:hypothetical protein